MDILQQINEQIDREFSDMSKQAKPLTKEQLENVLEYDKGVNDCINGVIHKSKNPAYDQGYTDQYAFEQIKDAMEIR